MTGGLVWGTPGADWGLWAWSRFWDAWSLLYLLTENLNLLCESPTITVRSEMFWGTRLSDLVKSPPDPEVDCEVEADCLSSVAWDVGGQGSSFTALLTMALQSRSTNLWNVLREEFISAMNCWLRLYIYIFFFYDKHLLFQLKHFINGKVRFSHTNIKLFWLNALRLSSTLTQRRTHWKHFMPMPLVMLIYFSGIAIVTTSVKGCRAWNHPWWPSSRQS